MDERLQCRLETMRKEFEAGRARLRELEMQQSLLRETLLRISGAIQVLEELSAETVPQAAESARPVVVPRASGSAD